jgi:hypothetical protein
MTSTQVPIRFILGEPPRITRSRTARGLAAIQQLLAARELEPGDLLTWHERSQQHYATVLADGRLRVGGRTVDSPSAAGRVAHGRRRPNGWDVWVCVRDGLTLAMKRQRVRLNRR